MNELELAGLKRKYGATQEPAKKNELRALLVRAGVDPDAPETASKPSKAPSGRSTRPLVTTEAPKPETAAPVKAEAKAPEVAEKPATPRRSPGRPRTKAADK